MPQFSRLQLAAALLEYDNDPDDPTKPFRSAQDSAIFTHLRLRTAPREAIMQKEEPQPRRSIDYLGVKLPITEPPPEEQKSPSEDPPRPPSRQSLDMLQQQRPASRQSFEQTYRPSSRAGSLHTMHVQHQRNQSRQSMDMLRPGSRQSMNTLGTSMFRGGDDDDDDDAASIEVPAVDLSSWGLDNFISKEELDNKDNKSKAPSVHSRAGSESFPPPAARSNTPGAAAPSSWNNPQGRRGRGQRAMSLGNQLETVAATTSDTPQDSENESGLRRKPTRSRSVGGALDAATFVQIEPVKFEKERRSSFSAGIPFPSQKSPTVDESQNPFELPLPSSARTSRFDPKVADHARRMSTISMGTMGGFAQSIADGSDFFGAGPPSVGTRDEYNQRVRTYSDATMGSRMRLTEFGDNMSIAPGAAFDRGPRVEERVARGPKRVSRMDLLRPKVLVMPSPLQDELPPPEKPVREGFEVTTDRRPFPPGARTGGAIASTSTGNPYTTNPRMSMSLSQLTFRNTLFVGGQMDAAYADSDLKRATEDGEQIPVEYADEELRELQRPVGKLYGRSLIDDLETRKAQMRGKQRVFRGDDRPSMMQRGQSHNTFIDPATLQQGHMVDEFGALVDPNPAARNKRTSQAPLLDFNGQSKTVGATPSRIPNARSVFGVDTVWERELAKLQKIEAEEKAEQEKEQAAEEARRQAAEKKAAKKRKGKGRADELAPDPDAEPRVSAEPPSLPAYQSIHVKPQKESDSDSDDDANIPARIPRRSHETAEDKGWYASSSEDENGQPKRRKQKAAQPSPRQQYANDSDSDDIPLAAQIGKSPRLRPPPPESDSDEDQPLSAVLDKKLGHTQYPSSPQRSRQGHQQQQDDDSDDDRPLALHQPRVQPPRTGGDEDEDEDEKPLGMRYNQTPFSQMQMQQQQMQQEQLQQMMFQQQMLQVQAAQAAQMRSSMMFGAAAPFSPFGMAPNPMMMGVPPPQVFNPQGEHDAVQYGRVDKWRRDVSSGVD